MFGFRNVAIISSCFRREDFFIGRGARREHSLSYATDEATKYDEKSRRPNREVIIAAFLSSYPDNCIKIEGEIYAHFAC